MVSPIDTDVLIVGGGPVGLTLGMDLAWRGIGVTIAEMRARASRQACALTSSAPARWKYSAVSEWPGRCARPGCPPIIRTTSPSGPRRPGSRLARVPIPCRADRYTAKERPDTGWPTPEPPHRINQMFLEPVLFAAAQHAAAAYSEPHPVFDFEQDDAGVLAKARESGHQRRPRDSLLATCRLRWCPFRYGGADRCHVERRCDGGRGAVDVFTRASTCLA